MNNPQLIRRTESLTILVAAVALYFHLEYPLGLFAILLLAPDVFMVGYIKNTAIGAATYNLGHSYTLPSLLLFVSFYIQEPDLMRQIGIIWIAHIAMDRAFGYGLKYTDAFTSTDLGTIGNKNHSKKRDSHKQT